jgi:D-alanyl-D-alanine carboxypeptidase
MRKHAGIARIAILLSISSCILVACGTASTTATDPPDPDGALSSALHKLVAMPGGPPGAIAIVQSDSRLRVVTAGVGDVTARTAIAADDTLRIASVSKAFSGAASLSLVSQDKLSLADTIGMRLPTLPEAWRSVTLAQLLQHTSGVPDYIKSPEFVAVLKADPLQSLTPMQLLGYVAHEPLAFPAGSRYDYSDSDNIVIGLMVEAVTGGSYEAALDQYVSVPLHLVKTTLPDNVQLPDPYVRGYDVEIGKPPDDVSMVLNPGLAWASGGMLSTPTELNEFMRGYARGELFSKATQAMQLQFVPGSSGPPGPGTNAAGLGIFRYQTSCGTVFGHTGNFPGYTLFAASSPGGKRSVVVAINQQLNNTPVTPAFTLLREAEGIGVCAALGR